MISSTSLTLALNLVADEMCGGRAPNEIVCLCTHCYNDADPLWNWAAHRAPDHAECLTCGRSGRAADGLLYAVRPRGGQ